MKQSNIGPACESVENEAMLGRYVSRRIIY